MAHLGALLAGLPDAISALSRPRRRGLEVQNDRLRQLIHHAKVSSPWHADRLRAIDVDTFTVADLPAIPPMTKADLLENWDRIVTDPRVTLSRAEEHLARVAEHGPQYLDHKYHVVRSSGTGNRPTTMLWDYDGWLAQALATYAVVGKILSETVGEQIALRIATMAGGHDATYFSQAVGLCFSSPMLSITSIPPALPLHQILHELDAIQPTALIGFPSMLAILAHARQQDRLHIQPRWLAVSGEPLYPETRTLLERVFDVPVSESWGTAETGPLAFGILGEAMQLDAAIAVVEPVDAEHQLCPPRTTSAATLVTNLVNKALPLIRYELDDEVTLDEPPTLDSPRGQRVIEVRGRRDDLFVYDNRIVVHPTILRHSFAEDTTITSYQVRQTPAGIHAFCTFAGDDTATRESQLRERLIRDLAAVGLTRPEVHVDAVDQLDRLPSGKIRRFVRVSDPETSATPAPASATRDPC